MSERKLNLKLLRKVRDRIAAIPESYDQSTFIRREPIAPCGSAECIAGDAVILSKPTIKQGIVSLRRMQARFESGVANSHGAHRMARRLLGLDEYEAGRMFSGDAEGWPQPYRSRFQRATRPAARASVAVAYLDECLKRKAVTW